MTMFKFSLWTIDIIFAIEGANFFYDSATLECFMHLMVIFIYNFFVAILNRNFELQNVIKYEC